MNDTSLTQNVINQSAMVFGTTPKDIVSDGRFAHIMRARHAACYILSEHYKMNRTAVGRILNRSRNTMKGSHLRAKYLIATDPAFQKSVEYIVKYLL